MAPIVTAMVQDNPALRPDADEIVDRLQTVRAQLSSSKLRSRISRRDDPWTKRLLRGNLQF